MGKSIQMTFTESEYSALVDMMLVADWVIHAHEVEERDETQSYRAVHRKVMSHVAGTSIEDQFVYDEDLDCQVVSSDLDDESAYRTLVNEYDNQSFWEELIERLADRDLTDEVGPDAAEKMPLPERYANREPFCERYMTEFERQGVTNLRLE